MSEKNEEIVETAAENEEAAMNDELVVTFKKPYTFEGKVYTKVDLSGAEDLTTRDMADIAKLANMANRVNPELSMEYACWFASRAAKLPVEFFFGLPSREGVRVKNRIIDFLFD